jgi:hypothetical protein
MRSANVLKMNALALHVAKGLEISEWCRENGVSRNTAKFWAGQEVFKQKVHQIRQTWLDQAVGRYNAALIEASEIIQTMARSEKNAAVRLQAARAIGQDMINFDRHGKMRAELAGLREEVRQLREGTNAGTSVPPGDGGAAGGGQPAPGPEVQQP